MIQMEEENQVYKTRKGIFMVTLKGIMDFPRTDKANGLRAVIRRWDVFLLQACGATLSDYSKDPKRCWKST